MSNESHGEFDVTPHGVKDHRHGWKLSSRKPRDPGAIRFFYGSGSVGKGARPQFRHARHRGVRQFHSTGEASEQGRGVTACGVGGGKGTDQGEHRAIATGPDTEPELGRETVRSQVAWIAGCTCSFCTSTSEVRAVCGSSARTNLCGGRAAMTVPTAIDNAAIPGLNCILHLTNPVRFVRASINLILRATTATRTKKWLAP
jgi:hypothetical protein